jgi:hypothetical protein
MLITNFASGELSETLFGRVDIPQYFNGVSRLENFDVIPTGGIRRRGGMERLAALEGEGRAIPFLLNRDLGFLLYLTPGKITAYRLENGRASGAPAVFTSGANITLYADLEEIGEVQYAQNFDTMMLCHENYRPLAVTVANNLLSISRFSIDTEVERNAQKEVNTEGFYERDSGYEKNGWLDRAGQWPKTVTFFCGRVVFAGTRNSPQRIFVSSTGNVRKFATYKKFITETREYITINGKIRVDSNEIEMLDPWEFGKFRKELSSYYVQSPYLSEGTRVVGITGNVLKLAGNTNSQIDRTELDAFLTWKNNIQDTWSSAYKYYEDHYMGGSSVLYYDIRRIRYSLGKFETSFSHVHSPASETVFLTEITSLENIKECVTDKNYLYNFVYGRIGSPSNSNGRTFYQAEFSQFIDSFYSYIQSTMKYTYTVRGASFTFYGTPEQIYQQILEIYQEAIDGISSFVSLYTKDYTVDSYPTPDCGFTFEIASDMNDAVKWLAVNKGLIIGTESAEWIVPPGVHATNVQATLNSRYGSDKIQGTAIGDATCFFQAGKKALVEYYIPQQDNNFRANNMAMLSPQMLGESPAKEFDFTSSPYAKLVVTREDGTAAALLYDRGTGTFAWGRIATAGKICSTAVLPGKDGNDELYLAVKRGELFYLEVLRENCGVFLDSFGHWDGSSTGYTDEAVAHNGFIGYPYASSVRSMPILANSGMKPNNIKNLMVRFLDSFMPRLRALPNGAADTITCREPFTGVHKIPFPGVWDHDVMFEFIHDKPNRCQLLAISAEVN